MEFRWGDISDVLNIFEYTYANGNYLWFLLFIPVIFFIYYYRDLKKPKFIKFSTLAFFKESSPMAIIRHAIPILRALAFTGIIISLARPQDILDETYQNKVTEGIDIILAMDISTSMDALDLEPDRLGAAKEIAKEFIDNRPNDRIGMVIFDSEALTQCPLTTDHKYLKESIDQIYSGMIIDGTAIGDGINTAINRLRESKSKSKVIILLTDGINTHGSMHPLSAADIAATYNVRIYTIGVGRDKNAPYRLPDMFGRMKIVNLPSEVDMKTLSEISARTNGRAYRAKDKDALRNVYTQIDQLEKSKVKITKFRIEPPEKFHWFALLALIFIALEIILKNTLLKSITIER